MIMRGWLSAPMAVRLAEGISHDRRVLSKLGTTIGTANGVSKLDPKRGGVCCPGRHSASGVARTTSLSHIAYGKPTVGCRSRCQRAIEANVSDRQLRSGRRMAGMVAQSSAS